MALSHFVYGVMQKAVGAAGFNLVLTRRGDGSVDYYESVAPSATYAPWLADREFIETYGVAKDHTLVDKYKCYALWQLVGEAVKLDGALIEIGVWRGGSGALIAKRAKLAGIKDTVYLCDTFSGVVKAGEKDTKYKGGEHADTSKETVLNLARKLGLDNVKVLAGVFPEESGGQVDDVAFRFCHIDVDVYQSAKDVVEWLWPRLVVGGMVVFDDYGFQGCGGVTRFVNEERASADRLVMHNLNGQAVLVKLPPVG